MNSYNKFKKDIFIAHINTLRVTLLGLDLVT